MQLENYENLLASLDNLSKCQRDLVHLTLSGPDDFHKVVAVLESKLLQQPSSPRFQSSKVRRWARVSGLQGIRSESCHRTFNCLTGASFARLRKKDRLLRMSSALEEGLSPRKTAVKRGITLPTAFHWRHKFMRTAASARPVKIDGVVEADETYFLDSFKGSQKLPTRQTGAPPLRQGRKMRDIGGADWGSCGAGQAWAYTGCRAVLPDKSVNSVVNALGSAIGTDNILVAAPCADASRNLTSHAALSQPVAIRTPKSLYSTSKSQRIPPSAKGLVEAIQWRRDEVSAKSPWLAAYLRTGRKCPDGHCLASSRAWRGGVPL